MQVAYHHKPGRVQKYTNQTWCRNLEEWWKAARIPTDRNRQNKYPYQAGF